MVDKKYCMSSFLAFRYIEKDGVEFKEGLHHTLDIPYPEEKRVLVWTADDIAAAYKKFFEEKIPYVLHFLRDFWVFSAEFFLATFAKKYMAQHSFENSVLGQKLLKSPKLSFRAGIFLHFCRYIVQQFARSRIVCIYI